MQYALAMPSSAGLFAATDNLFALLLMDFLPHTYLYIFLTNVLPLTPSVSLSSFINPSIEQVNRGFKTPPSYVPVIHLYCHFSLSLTRTSLSILPGLYSGRRSLHDSGHSYYTVVQFTIFHLL